MASVVVKTIWQSKEIHEAGDPPAGVESRAQMIPEAPGGVTSPAKGISKKKKAVSFHGVEPRMSHEPMHWCLNLKRSSACTNVSLLNLAAVEATDSSVTDSTTEDSGSLALAPPSPTPPTPPWTPDDPDITELLSGVNSGLVRAKDSITSLKEKTTRVNQHVQTLQSECSVLSENLERRRQEAEELEGYCSQLKENCRKVTRSVEDAEIKTNVLKQNSALLEVRGPAGVPGLGTGYLVRLQAGLSHPTITPPPSCSRRSCATSSSSCRTRHRGGRKPSCRSFVMSEQEVQKVSAGLEDLRREVSSLTTCTASLGGAPSKPWLLFRFRVERSAVSVASLRSDLEGLGPVKPILEELGRQFQSSRRSSDLSMSLERAPQGSCTRCTSQGQQLSTESLQQLLERALTPLVDEVKQRGLAPACPSCQRLHKKILELERQALAKHVRAEALSSTLRLAQDEALRAKNLLLTDKMKPEEKVASLDYLHLKMCSLHDQLSNLPLEGSTGTMGGGSSGGTPPKRGGPNPEQ
ncbi:PREDICTED: testis-specific serine kinase substrate [Myotis brandtii]|uniref:testis-specific serine kinase substrate n=1 Tax=Myotis brandtii TaxID=109478 RepID=UPI0007042FD6|nr:PREDICTED: testis-specific serine kinase substrate [Myotis brandtii]